MKKCVIKYVLSEKTRNKIKCHGEHACGIILFRGGFGTIFVQRSVGLNIGQIVYDQILSNTQNEHIVYSEKQGENVARLVIWRESTIWQSLDKPDKQSLRL